MSLKGSLKFYILLSIAFLFICALTITVYAGEDQKLFNSEESFDNLAAEVSLHEDMILSNVPLGLDQSSPTRVVMQIIDNTFHKWKEYELDEPGEFCIIMIEPEYQLLDVQEALELLEASSKWVDQTPDPSQGYTLDYNDPSVDLPPVTMPLIDDLPLGLEEYIPEVVIGDDERVRVSRDLCQAHPHNTIGFIAIEFAREKFRGTGFLVSPHTILTNGHVIYSEDHGGYAKKIEFAPGQYQDSEKARVERPYGYREAYGFEVNPDYIRVMQKPRRSLGEEGAEDYAAVFIEQPFEGINTFMPLQFNTTDVRINTAGYPGQAHGKSTSSQWFSSGFAFGSENFNLITHYADTSGGQSGSPIWVFDGQTRRVIAIHALGYENDISFNFGPSLVDDNRNLIEGWMKWSPPGECSVNIPNQPSGPSSGEPNTSYTFTTGGASCEEGHSVEYRFDWGDGTYSSWSTQTSSSKSWSDTGTFSVRAQARCSVDNSAVSNWSSAKTVNIGVSTGSLQVTIGPSAVRDAGAQWQLTDGPDQDWKNSGDTIVGLPVGSYSITFNDIPGWTKPSDISVNITVDALATRLGTYQLLPVNEIELTADPENWQVKGEDITFTAEVIEGNENAEFSFWFKLPGGDWINARDYRPDNTWTQSTNYVGEVEIGVIARAAGSGAFSEARDSIEYEIVKVAPVESIKLSADPPNRQLRNEDIVFTAEVTEGNENAEFAFFFSLDGVNWNLGRSYDQNPNWITSTSYVGEANVGVIARAVGSDLSEEARDMLDYEIVTE